MRNYIFHIFSGFFLTLSLLVYLVVPAVKYSAEINAVSPVAQEHKVIDCKEDELSSYCSS